MSNAHYIEVESEPKKKNDDGAKKFCPIKSPKRVAVAVASDSPESGKKTSSDPKSKESKSKAAKSVGQESTTSADGAKKSTVLPSSKIDRESAESDQDEFHIAVLDRDEDFRYGWYSFRPPYLQWLRKPSAVLFLLCLCSFAHSFGINGTFTTSFRTMQMRFYLTPIALGQVRMSYDLAGLIVLFPVVYYGWQGANRPKWIGWSSFVMGLGCVVMASAHFVAEWVPAIGPYNHDWYRSDHVCHMQEEVSANHTDKPMDCAKANLVSWFQVMFIGASILYGCGSAAIYPMGMSYLDENVSHETSSLFTGILAISSLFGSVVGLLVGSFATSFYGNIPSDSKPDDRHGPNWYGAWWTAIFITALLNFLVAIPVSGLPQELPGGAVARINDIKDRRAGKGRYAEGEFQIRFDQSVTRSVLRSSWALLTSPLFMGLVIGLVCHSLMTTIFSTFAPVYLARTFRISNFTSNAATGAMVVVGALATLVGVYLQNRVFPGLLGHIRFSAITSMLGLLFVGTLVLSCSTVKMASYKKDDAKFKPYPIITNVSEKNHSYFKDGLRKPSEKMSFKESLESDCNYNCSCSVLGFKLVCYQPTADDDEAWTFYSKCHAGCTNNDQEKNAASDCRCVPLDFRDRSIGGGNVTEGPCRKHCKTKTFFAFLIGLAWLVLSVYIRRTAMEQSILRCVPHGLRILALAVCEALIKLLGRAPASPIFGVVLYHTCIVVQERCGMQGTCHYSDSPNLAMWTTVIAFITLFLGTCGLLMAWSRASARQKAIDRGHLPKSKSVQISKKNLSVGKSASGSTNSIGSACPTSLGKKVRSGKQSV